MKKVYFVLMGLFVLLSWPLLQGGTRAACLPGSSCSQPPVGVASNVAISGTPDVARQIASIILGGHPKGVSVDEQGNRAFVVLYDESQVVQIDATTNITVSWQSTRGIHPSQVAYASIPKRIYITNRDSDNVTLFDAGDTLVYRGALKMGQRPWGIAADANGQLLVSNLESSSLSWVNANHQETYHVPFSDWHGLDHPALAAYDSHNRRYYAVGRDTGNLYMVDSKPRLLVVGVGTTGWTGVAVDSSSGEIYLTNHSTGEVVHVTCTGQDQLDCQQVSFAQVPGAAAVVVNPNTQHLLVVGEKNSHQALYIFQLGTPPGTTPVTPPDTRQPLQTIELGSPDANDGGQGLAINLRNNLVLVTNYHDGRLNIIQELPYIVQTVSLGGHPKGIAINPDLDQVYVALYDSNQVAILDKDGTRLSVHGTQGTHPTQVLYRSDLDSTPRVYIANRDSNNVTLFNPAVTDLLGTVPTGAQPGSLAAANHRVYVSNVDSNDLTSFDADGTAVITMTLDSHPTRLAASNDKVYVPGDQGRLDMIDAGGQLESSLQLANVPLDAYAQDQQVWVTTLPPNPQPNHLYSISAQADVTHVITLTIPGYAFAADSDCRHAFVASAQDKQLHIVDSLTGEPVASIPIDPLDAMLGEQGIAINAHMHLNRVYVANYTAGTLTIIQDIATFARSPNTNAAPEVPEAVAPPDGWVARQPAVILDWTAPFTSGASYELEIRKDSQTGPLVRHPPPVLSQLTASPLAPGTYYWHVRATIVPGHEGWSNWASFSRQ